MYVVPFALPALKDGKSFCRFTKLVRETTEKTFPSMGISLYAAGSMGPSYDVRNPNRLRLYGELDIRQDQVACLRQEHTQIVHILNDTADASRYSENPLIGDGLISNCRDVILGVTSADCLPIFFFHISGFPFGVVHSGWKGTGIIQVALSTMAEGFDIPMDELVVAIGPGIGSCCYEVDDSRADYFRRTFGEKSVVGGNNIDLRQANIAICEKTGIGKVFVCSDCTSCSSDLGSFRREGVDSFTRMIALIGFLL